MLISRCTNITLSVTDKQSTLKYFKARALEMQRRLYYQQMQARQSRISPGLGDSTTEFHEELRHIDINAQKRQMEHCFEVCCQLSCHLTLIRFRTKIEIAKEREFHAVI